MFNYRISRFVLTVWNYRYSSQTWWDWKKTSCCKYCINTFSQFALQNMAVYLMWLLHIRLCSDFFPPPFLHEMLKFCYEGKVDYTYKALSTDWRICNVDRSRLLDRQSSIPVTQRRFCSLLLTRERRNSFKPWQNFTFKKLIQNFFFYTAKINTVTPVFSSVAFFYTYIHCWSTIKYFYIHAYLKTRKRRDKKTIMLLSNTKLSSTQTNAVTRTTLGATDLSPPVANLNFGVTIINNF